MELIKRKRGRPKGSDVPIQKNFRMHDSTVKMLEELAAAHNLQPSSYIRMRIHEDWNRMMKDGIMLNRHI